MDNSKIFPAWRYHKDCIEGKIFQTAEELKRAGPGWLMSPADIGKPEPKPAQKPAAPPPPPPPAKPVDKK